VILLITDIVDKMQQGDLPSSHDITVTTEDFRQTADNNVCIRKDIDVDEIANTLIDYHAKVVLVCELAYALEIWRHEERVRGEFCKQGHESFTTLQSLFKVVELL
jgi:hypothetical protein